MTTHVLFIQGAGDGAHDEDARLAASLRARLGPGYEVRYPAMPDEEDADYRIWQSVILQEIEEIGVGAMLVGHSVGASVLIKMFTTPGPKPPLAAMFLVAGPFWHDHEFWRWDEATLCKDAAANFPRGAALFIYHGESDEVVPLSHFDMYLDALPQATARRLPGRNHQLNDDMYEVARDIDHLVHNDE
jgi:uncharacterized protein